MTPTANDLEAGDSAWLNGRVAVVTGASRGAGRAIAAVLGEHGANGQLDVIAVPI